MNLQPSKDQKVIGIFQVLCFVALIVLAFQVGKQVGTDSTPSGQPSAIFLSIGT